MKRRVMPRLLTAKGFLRELGRNDMQSSYLYSHCKGLARIAYYLRQSLSHSLIRDGEMLPRKETNVKNGLNGLEVRQYLASHLSGPTLKLEKKTPDHPRLKLRQRDSGKGDSKMAETVQVSIINS